jgi:hypothetical protein
LQKTESCVIYFSTRRIGRLRREVVKKGRRSAFETFCTQPETRVGAREDFFIGIGCNPLKSPDSEK